MSNKNKNGSKAWEAKEDKMIKEALVGVKNLQQSARFLATKMDGRMAKSIVNRYYNKFHESKPKKPQEAVKSPRTTKVNTKSTVLEMHGIKITIPSNNFKVNGVSIEY